MHSIDPRTFSPNPDRPNGSGAAALLATGIASFTLAVVAIASDRIPAFRLLMSFYKPTGPLSGVTTSALAVWLVVWGVLDLRWRNRNLRLGPVSGAAILLLLIGFLLMFPPVADLF